MQNHDLPNVKWFELIFQVLPSSPSITNPKASSSGCLGHPGAKQLSLVYEWQETMHDIVCSGTKYVWWTLLISRKTSLLVIPGTTFLIASAFCFQRESPISEALDRQGSKKTRDHESARLEPAQGRCTAWQRRAYTWRRQRNMRNHGDIDLTMDRGDAPQTNKLSLDHVHEHAN